MPFGIGILEIAAICVAGFISLAMLLSQFSGYRWMVAFWGCLFVSAILSPPDIFSTLLLTPVFMAIYYAGTLGRLHSQSTH